MPSVPDQEPNHQPDPQSADQRGGIAPIDDQEAAVEAILEAASAVAGDPESYDASQIQVLEGLEAVRKRPGMYIGSTGERGLHHLVYEVVDNSVDEALAGHATHIEVTMLADGGIRVVDDGRGIPTDIVASEGKPAIEVVLTVLHAGGKFGGGGYQVSGGLHGVGVSVVNALSSRLDVEVRREGHVYRQSYTVGVPDAPLSMDEATDESGTTITFWASADVFDTLDFDFETLRTRFQQMAFLNKGLTITLTDERPAPRRRGRQRAVGDLPLRGRPGRLRQAPQRVQEERPGAPGDHRLRVRGHGPDDLGRDRHAVDHGVLRERAHLREHHQHPRGRHARGGLPRRADQAGQRLRARQGDPQGEGREPHRRRHPRGPDRGAVGQAARAAVRGPDQDQARQQRGQGLRAAGGHRRARALVRRASQRGPRRDPQVDQRRSSSGGGAQGARGDPAQGPARVELVCRASCPTASSTTRRAARSTSSRATRPAARPRAAATR